MHTAPDSKMHLYKDVQRSELTRRGKTRAAQHLATRGAIYCAIWIAEGKVTTVAFFGSASYRDVWLNLL